jgi:phage head maturation protease
LNFGELEERGIVKERRSVDGERRFIEVLDPEALIRVLEERGVI